MLVMNKVKYLPDLKDHNTATADAEDGDVVMNIEGGGNDLIAIGFSLGRCR
jgi:hypothetical protein